MAEALDGGTARELRGDPITGERYYCREFMTREWDGMWSKVWHLGCREQELPLAGDYVVHDLRNESVVMVRQADGGVRAFYNSCRHRGNRLVWAPWGGGDGFSCSYHGWRYGIDGVLAHVQDPDDFEGGNPCGTLALVELSCERWGGMVWWAMEPSTTLAEFLDPIPALLDHRRMQDMVRVIWRTFDVDANWKFASDNFNESYHLPTVHPELSATVDEDYRNTTFEMYPNGHNRMIEQGQPSLRSPEPNEVCPPWDAMLKSWDLDPASFAGRSREGRAALQKAKRTLGPARGYDHFEALSDGELTDYYHHTLFPNVTITATGEGVNLFRTEPHATDPERCTFDFWWLVPRVDGVTTVDTICGPRPLEEATREHITYGSGAEIPDMAGSFLTQDLGIAVGQQRGFHSRGYTDAHLCGQESRVRRFHEVLNDYIAGRR